MRREGWIKDKGNGRIEEGGGGGQGRGVVDIGGERRKRFGRGREEKEGGKLLRVYSTVL